MRTQVEWCNDPNCCSPAGYNDPALQTRCPKCKALDQETACEDGLVDCSCILCKTAYDPRINYWPVDQGYS